MKKLFRHKVQTFTSPPDPEGKSLVLIREFTPDTQEELLAKGSLFILAEVWAEAAFNKAVVSRLVEDTFSSSYYKNRQNPPLISLEKALSHLRQVFFDYVSDTPELAASGLHFNVAGTVLWGQVIYLSFLGEGVGYLFSEGEIKLIQPEQGVEISTSSGAVSPGDALLVGSGAFAQSFPGWADQADISQLESQLASADFSRQIGVQLLKLEEVEVLGKAEAVAFLRPKTVKIAFLGSILPFFRSLVSRLKNKKKVRFPRLSYSKPSLQLRPPRKIKWWFWSIIAVLLVGGAVAAITQRRRLRQQKLVDQFLTSSQQVTNDASAFIGLNNNKARDLITDQLRQLDTVLGLADNQPQLLEEQKRLQGLLDQANNTTRVTNPEFVYDLSRQSSNSSPVALGGFGSDLFVLDSGSRFLYRLGVATLPATIEKGVLSAQEGGRAFACSADYCWLVKEGEVGVISRTDLAYQRIETDLPWLNGAVDFAYYQAGSDFLYWLVPEDSQIYRTAFDEDNLEDSIFAWLTDNTSLAEAVSLAVDGSIYVGFESGNVVKFYGGERDDFELKNVPEPLVTLTSLYTTSDLEYLYVLSGPDRILVFTKEGYYRGQYIFEGLDDRIGSFWVDSGGADLYVLVGTKVFKVAL